MKRPYGEVFNVMGRIDFEHDSSSYSLTRTQTYKKNLNDSEKVKEEVQLNKLDGDYNWRRVDNPIEVIDKMLPSGLSDYFFFDGESMIADLRTKSVDSASKLKKALYSMFDLDVLDSAAKHIGNTDLKTTVLGKLYLSKGTLTSDEFIKTKKAQIEGLQNKLDDLKTLNADIPGLIGESKVKGLTKLKTTFEKYAHESAMNAQKKSNNHQKTNHVRVGSKDSHNGERKRTNQVGIK